MKYSFIILLISGTIAIHASEDESIAAKLTVLNKDESMIKEEVLELFCDEIFNLADEDNRSNEKLMSCKAFSHYSLSELKDHLMLQQSIADYYNKDHKGYVACCLFNIYAKLYLEKVKNEYRQDFKDKSVDVLLLKDELPMLQKIAHHKKFEEKSKHSINEYINREKAAKLHSKYVNLYMMVADSKIEPYNILFKSKK